MQKTAATIKIYKPTRHDKMENNRLVIKQAKKEHHVDESIIASKSNLII